MVGGIKAVTFGIEDREVVGEVSGGRDKGFDVEGVKGFARVEVSLRYACF